MIPDIVGDRWKPGRSGATMGCTRTQRGRRGTTDKQHN
jgi:hypothetical protein